MRKKIISLATACLILSSSIIAYAADTQTATSAGNYATDVYYTGATSFNVTLPNSITLDNTGKGTYNVSVSGDIAGYDTVTVLPDNTFTMKQSGKTDVIGTITQATTTFSSSDLAATKTVNGSLSASGLSAGIWKGSFKFAVNISTNAASPVDVTLDAEVLNNIKDKTIYVLGDSLMEGAGNDYIGFDYYTNLYYGTKSKNFAVSGSSFTKISDDVYASKLLISEQVANLANRVAGMKSWDDGTYSNIIDENAKLNENNIIVLNGGNNDLINGKTVAEIIPEFEACMTSITSFMDSSNSPEILFVAPINSDYKTVTPDFSAAPQMEALYNLEKEYMLEIEKYADSSNIKYIPHFHIVYANDVITTDDLASDYAHYNASGQLKLAKYIAEQYSAIINAGN